MILRQNVQCQEKKTIQPAPLEVHDYGDLIVEIIDKDTRPIGRGQDKAFNSSEFDFQVLNKLVDMYLSKEESECTLATELLEGERKISKLAKQLALWGYEEEDRALREHAKSIRKHWRVFKAAMAKNGNPPLR